MKIFLIRLSLAVLFFLLAGCSALTRTTAPSSRVYLYPHKGPPLVTVRLVLEGGNAFDRKGGEVYLLSRILTQSGLSRILEDKGSLLSVEADYDYLVLEYSLLSDSAPETTEKVLDFLSQYRISPEEFSLAKTQLIQELAIQKDDFYHQARYRFYEELYDGHRYGRPITGSLASVSSLNLEDVRGTYSRVFRHGLASLIVVGKTREDQKKFYEKILKKLPCSDISEIPGSSGLLPDSQHRIVRKKVPSTQVFVRVGTLGISRNHPDYLKYMVMADMIGGGVGSILMKKLREESGLTYSPVANFYSQRKEKGYFFLAYSTRPQNLEKSLELIRNIFHHLKTQGVTAENFEMSRRYIYGSLLQREETNSGIAGFLTEQAVFHLSPFFWKNYPEILRSLRYEEVNGLLKRFFRERKMLYVILEPQEK